MSAMQESLNALSVAIHDFSIRLNEATRRLTIALNWLLDHQDVMAEDYVVRVLGIPESDIREILFVDWKRGPHVRLWNGRRVPLGDGWPT